MMGMLHRTMIGQGPSILQEALQGGDMSYVHGPKTDIEGAVNCEVNSGARGGLTTSPRVLPSEGFCEGLSG